MSNWYTYLFQSSVSLAALYLVFVLFMRKDTFFTVNRLYLMGAVVLSSLLPLFRAVPVAVESLPDYVYLLETITVTPSEVSVTLNSRPGMMQLITVAYITGAAIFLVRFLVQLTQLGLLVKKYGITRAEGVRLVLIHREYSPFSFFRLIFINARDYQPGQLREIMEHEKVHVRQMHTIDLIILEILTVLQWFNPFIWLYRRSLKSVHEYLADEGVLLKGAPLPDYQQMLLNQALGIQLNDLTNNFNHSLLKRRFIMMTKKRSGILAVLKPILAAPLVALLITVFSLPGGNAVVAQDKDKQAEISQKATQAPDEGTVAYETVSRKPEFKGGEAALIQYIVSNVKYPEEAKKNGITGKVYVEFEIDIVGKVKNARIKQSVDPLLDAEALRVISRMPDWQPGYNDKNKPVRVLMVMPIMFQLDNSKGEKK